MDDKANAARNTDRLHCGLSTVLRSVDGISGLHIGWIDWDSGFRDSDLRVGDAIIAVNGAPIIDDIASAKFKEQVGLDLEQNHWQALDAQAGHKVILQVRRKRVPGTGWEFIDIEGRVEAERNYINSEGRRLCGEQGPERLTNDGFADSWSSWAERRRYIWERQLDGFIWDNAGDSRMALADHLHDQARVEFLLKQYPGPFARAVVEDWQAVKALLEGRRYDIDPKELLFREDETKIRLQATATALAAWDGFLAQHADAFIEHPGTLSMAHSDFKVLEGKYIKLPPSPPDQWITDVGEPYVAWRLNGGWAVTRLQSVNFQRAWRAHARYRQHVSPTINDEVSLAGRIVAQPRLIHPGGDEAAVIALEVEPVAALFGDSEAAMFVDLQSADGEVTFAGEDDVRALPVPTLPEDAGPRQVMETLFDAVHARDDKTWYSLFARWQVLIEEGQSYFYPYSPYPDVRRDPDWTKSRRTVLGSCFALRVVWIDDPVDISPKGIDGMPRIERVIVEIDHVGQFDGAYHAYNLVEVHRHWHLGRIDGGPWRIMTQQGI